MCSRPRAIRGGGGGRPAPSGATAAPGPRRVRAAGAGRRPWLSRLPVQRVLAVPAAVLLHLDALAVVDLALHRDVVPPLADLTSQRDLDPLLIRHVPNLL